MTMSDLRRLAMENKGEAAADDLDNFQKLREIHRAGRASGSGGIDAPAANIKQEPIDPQAVMKANILFLRTNIRDTHRKYADMLVDYAAWKAKAEDSTHRTDENGEYLDILLNSITANVKRVQKVEKTLKKMVISEFNDEGVPIVLKLMEAADKFHAAVVNWAVKLNVTKEPKKGKKRKDNQA
jgi:hypothetical protein